MPPVAPVAVAADQPTPANRQRIGIEPQRGAERCATCGQHLVIVVADPSATSRGGWSAVEPNCSGADAASGPGDIAEACAVIGAAGILGDLAESFIEAPVACQGRGLELSQAVKSRFGG